MKHYVLIIDYGHEGHALSGVFDSAEAAREWMRAKYGPDGPKGNDWYAEELWVMEGDTKVADLGRYPFAETVVLP